MDYCIYCGKKLLNTQSVCLQCGRTVRSYRSIRTYRYRPIPAQVAERITLKKDEPEARECCRKLTEIIRAGRAETAVVRVDQCWRELVALDGTEQECRYINVSDLSGHPAPEAVRVPDGILLQAGQRALLLHYTLQEEQTWLAIGCSSCAGPLIHAEEIIRLHGQKTVGRQLPILEGSVVDRGMKLFADLFGGKVAETEPREARSRKTGSRKESSPR